MAPFKPKPRQPPMTKAELRAQGIQALAQVTTPIIKLPMKIRRQCDAAVTSTRCWWSPGKQCRRSSVRPAVTQRGETRDFGLKTPRLSPTLHGEAHGRKNHRGKGESRFHHIAARHDHGPDPGGGRT